MGENVVAETLHRARLRDQLCPSPAHTDSAGESPWEESSAEEGEEEEEEEEERPAFPKPVRPQRNRHPHAEDKLRKIREELASQRIEGATEPGDSQPRKLTRSQLHRMRTPQVIQLDTPLSTS